MRVGGVSDTYLPVEMDTDVGSHVLGTNGQDLEKRQEGSHGSLYKIKLNQIK